ncbi:putative sodium bile acid cotransporter [Aspergillus pseudodeflectus]|uniref:Sodium bile acid cotransporter n=1 Tax=Aspergillus pseudodeflectus TaxID=176178 RepID=A0ABR4KX80_9EURO
MTPAEPTWKRVAKFIIAQWLIIGIGIACLLAYLFPNVAKHGGIIRSEYSVLYGAVAIVFLISGLSIPQEKLVRQLFNWRLHVLVQATSFLFVPAVVLAVVHAILAGDHDARIDRAVLAGYIFTACIPTTIASNVVMTRSAGGDDAAALAEVLIANLLGPFVTAGWTVTLLPKSKEFDVWRDGDGDLTSMYRDVFKQLGLAVLLPLAVGQLVRFLWSKQTAYVMQKYRIAKLGSACLLLMIWTTFSSCFATGALEALSTETIVFVTLFNIALYVFLTAVCFALSRPPQSLCRRTTFDRWQIFKQIPPVEAIAVCFCGPAKSTALGIPLLYAMWTPVDLFLKAKTSVPVLLYTTEQMFVAHFFVHAFRWWTRRLDKRRDWEEAAGDRQQSHASPSEVAQSEVKSSDMRESQAGNAP